jgi:hypothetical protein
MYLDRDPRRNIGTLVRRVGPGQIIALAFALCVALMLSCTVGFGAALHAGIVPSFDIHLTVDGRHALVIHNVLPCTPAEPPQAECTAREMGPEFTVIYSTPQDDHVLVVLALPGVP